MSVCACIHVIIDTMHQGINIGTCTCSFSHFEDLLNTCTCNIRQGSITMQCKILLLLSLIPAKSVKYITVTNLLLPYKSVYYYSITLKISILLFYYLKNQYITILLP